MVGVQHCRQAGNGSGSPEVRHDPALLVVAQARNQPSQVAEAHYLRAQEMCIERRKNERFVSNGGRAAACNPHRRRAISWGGLVAKGGGRSSVVVNLQSSTDASRGSSRPVTRFKVGAGASSSMTRLNSLPKATRHLNIVAAFSTRDSQQKMLSTTGVHWREEVRRNL